LIALFLLGQERQVDGSLWYEAEEGGIAAALVGVVGGKPRQAIVQRAAFRRDLGKPALQR
jgi:hypothetical protein